MQQFLMVRRDDLIHFGIQWSDFRIEFEESLNSKRPRLVAMSDKSAIIITFPPQAIAEELYDWESGYRPRSNDVPQAASRISGNSKVVFSMPKDTPIELTVEGILVALKKPGVRIILHDGLSNESTAIEVPWGLIVSAVTQSGNGTVVSEHPVLPISESGVTGLWYSQLKASEGNAENAGLALMPLQNLPKDIIYYGYPERIIGPPIVFNDRERILQESGYPSVSNFDLLKLPRAKKLELSVLGGSLSATANWKTFEWDHEVVLGRDQKVRKLIAGILYPFGHKAYVEVLTERVFINGKAVLTYPENKTRLVVTEPVVDFNVLEFPFDKVEIMDTSFNIDPPELGENIYIPKFRGKCLRFPIRCVGTLGDVFFNVELVFGSQESLDNISELRNKWKEVTNNKIPLQGVTIDLVRDARRNSDYHDDFEVHELTIISELHEKKIIPKLDQMIIELPVLRELMNKPCMLTPVKFTDEFKNLGANATCILTPINIDGIGVNFTDHPNQSGGLIAPKFCAKEISRTMGPIPPLKNVDVKEIFKDATLLGLPLAEVIKDYSKQGPPNIIPVPGNPPGAKMEWKDLSLKDCGPFITDKTIGSSVTLKVERSEVWCEVKNFNFVLPLNLVSLRFGSLAFTQKPNCAPDLQIKELDVEFGGELKLLKKLLDCMMEMLPGNRPTINPTREGVSASYTLGLPNVDAGIFLLRNVAVNFGINVPFSPKPVTMSLAFGRRDNPFNLSVMMFGGGGHIEVEFSGEKLSRLEASMEFGAMVAVNFIVASAEVHALGGVRFLISGNNIEFDAFIRIGGSLEVLGLVSVSVELKIQLNYKESSNCLYGHANLVIEVDLPLFSESVTIDSGKWELCGTKSRSLRSNALNSPEDVDLDRKLMNFMKYFEAFEKI
ncbi:hypothetical protein [Bacillus cereus]|uniref:hypothetical protein n=1 Tax=Bacillus cereus TaxID=1396 RepID=UPI0013D55437|nr:hypothetical protein [Bacillus cereus]